MQIIDWQQVDAAAREAALARPRLEGRGDIDTLARSIIREVRADGDAALRRFAQRFDRATLDSLQVAPEEFDAAEKALSAVQITALETAIDNVRRFHAAQLGTPISMDVMPGVRCERLFRPIPAVAATPGRSTPARSHSTD